ncbi:MAG: hypothetical protein P9L99_13465 [Candidatus Lernaella stagnicola]|nr:hypothetical protein [Candidatus Lernaella stagnicola]
MGRRFITLGLLMAAVAALFACEHRVSPRELATVKTILRQTVIEYQRPVFAEKMEKQKTPLEALQYALTIQEDVAGRHGWSYEKYLVTLRAARQQSEQVEQMLERVRKAIRAHQKFPPNLLYALESMERPSDVPIPEADTLPEDLLNEAFDEPQ